eukprot:sb/3477891/
MLTCPYTEAGHCKPAHHKFKECVSKSQRLFLSSAKTQNAQKANLYYLQQTCPILIGSTLTLNSEEKRVDLVLGECSITSVRAWEKTNKFFYRKQLFHCRADHQF